jgi:hypothetical protein
MQKPATVGAGCGAADVAEVAATVVLVDDVSVGSGTELEVAMALETNAGDPEDI